MSNQPLSVDVKWLVQKYNENFGIDITRLIPPHTETIELRRDEETDIQQFFPKIVGDGEFYAKLSKLDWYYQESKAEYTTAGRITTGLSVCEIGSGAGDFARFSGASHYVGLELNPKSVELAASKAVVVTLEDSDDHLARVGESSYEAVCAFQVLEHVSDPDSFVSTVSRLVKKDGWVIFSVPADDSFVGLVPRNILNMPPHHQTRWSDRSLDLLGPRHGLHTVAIIHENVDRIHYRWAASSLLRSAVPRGGGAICNCDLVQTRRKLAFKPPERDAKSVERAYRHGCVPEALVPDLLEGAA